MSGNFYNLIMATVPEFYSGDEGEFTIPKDRFLQYTEDNIKEEFQSLDQGVIERLKSLPTIFATEDEATDARIGKITDIKVSSHAVKAKYKFDEDRYPLTSGVLKENWQKLGISESNFEFHRGHWGVKECDLDEFYEEYLKSLTGMSHQLKNADKKVQLIYAFNGSGKTRLSRKFKQLIAPKIDDVDGEEQAELSRTKILYYNAFTEDLFYWDNDLEGDAEPKLIIQPNSFTDWILGEQGQDQNVTSHFQRYANNKLTPRFKVEDKEVFRGGKKETIKTFPEVTFSLERGTDEHLGNLKISKGEESNFIWSIFYTLLDQIITILNEPEEERTDQFNDLEYVFIDDPVSSLDDNHLIELAVNLAELIKDAPARLKFVITTHSPLFYNVLHHELKMSDKRRKGGCYLLERFEDGTFNLDIKGGSANKSFSYHLHIKKIIENAYTENKIEKYHFMLLRNLYEKTCGFLGYKQWTDLLPEDARDNYKRLINTHSHRHLSYEEKAEPTTPEKQTVKFLLDHLSREYAYNVEADNDTAN